MNGTALTSDRTGNGESFFGPLKVFTQVFFLKKSKGYTPLYFIYSKIK